MERIFWSGYTNKDRHSAIICIKDIVLKYGDLVDFQFFSDISVSISIEVAEMKIDLLYHALSEQVGMKDFALLRSVSDKERTVYLNVTFGGGSIPLPS